MIAPFLFVNIAHRGACRLGENPFIEYICSSCWLWHRAGANEPQRVARLEERVSTLEKKIRRASDVGLVLFLFGAFCALWTQNSGRSDLYVGTTV